VTVLRDLRAAGITQPVISPTGMDGNYWISAIPDLSNFYYAGFVSIYGDDPNPQVNALVKELQRRLHKPLAGSTAVSGYSVIQAFKIAAERARSIDQNAVMKQLQHFRNVKLITGSTTFTPTVRQSLGRPMRIIQVRDGKFHFVTIFTPKGVHL